MRVFVIKPFSSRAIFDGYAYDKQLEDLETYYIHRYLEEGKNLLNNKKTKNIGKAMIFEVKEITFDTDKFNIGHDTNNRRYNIQYRDDGKKICKTFSYVRQSEEEAMRQAQAARDQLIRDMLL